MIGRELGFAIPRRYNQTSDVWVLPECFMGAEFEFENVGTTPARRDRQEDWMEFIRDVADHSLRGAGREFVFARPLMGQDAYDAISGMCRFATEHRYVTNLRTGFHIHVDIRDLDYTQLKRMILFNALLEPSLYNYVGDNRDENVFCLPWYAADGIVKDIRTIYRATGDALHRAARAVNNRKYTGCNLDPISRFGSIEFRHLRCTTNLDALMKWINICLRIKEASVRLNIKPRDIVGKATNTAFWEEVLQTQYQHLQYPSFLQDIKDKSLCIAKEILSQNMGFGRILAAGPNEKVRAFLTNKLKTSKPGRPTAGSGPEEEFSAEIPPPRPRVVNVQLTTEVMPRPVTQPEDLRATDGDLVRLGQLGERGVTEQLQYQADVVMLNRWISQIGMAGRVGHLSTVDALETNASVRNRIRLKLSLIRERIEALEPLHLERLGFDEYLRTIGAGDRVREFYRILAV